MGVAREWGSKGWRDDAEDWTHQQLDRVGFHSTGAMSDVSIQRWSAVWRMPTNRGAVVLKQTTLARAVEGSVHAFCAEAAPEYVDRPLAYDPSTARILFTDGGPVMSWTSTSPLDLEAIAAMMADYAHLQTATIGCQLQAEAAGVRTWDPAGAAREAEQQAAELHALPTRDPRHITALQRDLLLAHVDELAVSGATLAASPVPAGIDHGDLWPGNVLLPRGAGPYRFIDFGDAAWSHPFLSVLPVLLDCHRRCSLPGSLVDSLSHPSLQTVIDSYLAVWVPYASRPELLELLGHALRLTPLRRSRALISNFQRATSSDTDDLGPTPWAWLTTMTTFSTLGRTSGLG